MLYYFLRYNYINSATMEGILLSPWSRSGLRGRFLMWTYVVRRLLQSIVVLIGVTLISFIALQIGGDPAQLLERALEPDDRGRVGHGGASPHRSPASRMLAEFAATRAPVWSESGSRSYHLSEAQVRAREYQPGPGQAASIDTLFVASLDLCV